jgi:hypothetical protein
MLFSVPGQGRERRKGALLDVGFHAHPFRRYYLFMAQASMAERLTKMERDINIRKRIRFFTREATWLKRKRWSFMV